MSARAHVVASAVAVIAAALCAASPAVAGPSYLVGESCALTGKLKLSVKGKRRKVTLAKGETVEVVRAGPRFTQLKGYDAEGMVSTKALARVCPIKRDRCTLKTDVTMRGIEKLDGKAFRVKKGARITLMRYRDKGVDVVAGDLTGRASRKKLRAACPKLAQQLEDPVADAGDAAPDGAADGAPVADAAVADAAPPEPATTGPEIVVMAFALAKGASAGRAANYYLELKEELSKLRPGVAGGGHPAGYVAEPRGLKAHLNESREQAREAGARFMITGRLATKGGDTLTLARIEVETGKVKGINARPTGRPGDSWAKSSAALLVDEIPAELGTTPVERPPAAAPAPVAAAPETEPSTGGDSPWFVNGLAYTALGAGAVLAGTGAALGTVALVERSSFDATAQVSEDRAAIGQRMVTEAIAADALYASAAVLGTAALVFFVTGLDYDMFAGDDDSSSSADDTPAEQPVATRSPPVAGRSP